MPKAHVATAPAETAAPHRLAATARRQALTEPRLPRRNKATGLKRIQDRDAAAARARRAAASPERHYKKGQGQADGLFYFLQSAATIDDRQASTSTRADYLQGVADRKTARLTYRDCRRFFYTRSRHCV